MSEDGRLNRIACLRSLGTDLDGETGLFRIELHWRDHILSESIVSLSNDSDFVSCHRLADGLCALAEHLRAAPSTPDASPATSLISCIPALLPGERLSE